MGLSEQPAARQFCPTTGKARQTKGEAKSTAKRMSRTRNGRGVTAYKCGACGGWHVGNRR